MQFDDEFQLTKERCRQESRKKREKKRTRIKKKTKLCSLVDVTLTPMRLPTKKNFFQGKTI